MRCNWAKEEPNKTYHDTRWGKPVYDDKILFEYLVLEGAQAGLSWTTILKKKDNYKEVFLNYNIEELANLSPKEIENILLNPKIIRNKLKVNSVKKNALGFLKIQEEFGSFSNYIWAYTNNKQIINYPKNDDQIASQSELSEKISKDLKKRGFSFVGSTIIYSYLQAIGIIDDHIISCEFKMKNK